MSLDPPGLDAATDAQYAGLPSEIPAGFIEPVAMEADPFELFSGDTGTLEPEARNVLVDLLRRRYLFANRNPERWKTLLEYQAIIESRLHDLYVTLVIDRDRGIAYKKQVRSEEVDNPILLKDDPFNRAETIILVQLRALNQRGDGTEPIRVDGEELESQALTFFPETSGDLASIQKEIRSAIQRLAREGFLIEEAPGRYRITPLVEIVLSVDRLTELATWLNKPSVEERGARLETTARVQPGFETPAVAGSSTDGDSDVVEDEEA